VTDLFLHAVDTVGSTRLRERRGVSERPLICYLDLVHVGTAEHWKRDVEDCGELHFNTICTPPPFAAGRAQDPFLAGDFHSAASDFLSVTDTDEAVRKLAGVAGDNGLALFLDFVLDRVDRHGAIARSRPDLFAAEAMDVIDPRSDVRATIAHFEDPDRAEELLELWFEVLSRLVQAGAAGFRFLHPEGVPPVFLRRLLLRLREQSSGLAMLAWTPGLKWSQIAALETVGLDGVFSSLPWWNFHAAWFFEEYDLLRRVAPVLGCPEAPPPEGRGNLANVGGGEFAPLYEQRLRFAACGLDGILTPARWRHADVVASPGSPPRGAENKTRGTTASIGELNRLAASRSLMPPRGELRKLSVPGDAVTAAVRFDGMDARLAHRALAILVNTDLRERKPLRIAFDPISSDGGAPFAAGGTLLPPALLPGEIRVVELERTADVRVRPRNESQSLKAAMQAVRVVIDQVRPAVDAGRYATKCLVGDTIAVSADIFSDGHGVLAADLLWKAADEKEWRRVAMRMGDNDCWTGTFRPSRVGRHAFTIEGWADTYATLCHAIAAKLKASIDPRNEIDEARKLVEDALSGASVEAELGAKLSDPTEALLSPETQTQMRTLAGRPFLTRHPPLPLDVERPQAGIGAWYEMFPRSASGTGRHGTFADVVERLPAIRAMGFDVLYFPPIHPIGMTHRKGRNNSLSPSASDPGSCYAIGSAIGGHDAILAELGSFADFSRLRDAAATQGLEIALDFAIQCSPDHPWLKEHPDWFRWQSDGTIRYSENPPKKYEDIVNVEFYAEPPVTALWLALRDIVLFWIGHGIRIFRVDNPHTKPLPFWEWMIADVRSRHPDVIFLAEAFTRPKMMYRLAKIGFSQSYTYFTWRNTKTELTEYLTELSTEPVCDFFRPHFFVNTPDINPHYLQTSGRAGFLARAALAATLSSLWGMYSGFELCEAAALPGREEYLDSEKYEIKARDYAVAGNITAEVARLNQIRKSHPALQSQRGLAFYPAFNDHVLVYGRKLPGEPQVVVVAVNLDPLTVQEATFELPLAHLGVGHDSTMIVEDLMRGQRFLWTGALQHVRLDPQDLPFAIWCVSNASGPLP
jgi:starch synthase (maltosyl-transferring)